MRQPRADFGALIEIVRAIRNARTEANVEPGRWIAAEVFPGPHARWPLKPRGVNWGSLARIADDDLRHARWDTRSGVRRTHGGRRQRRGHVCRWRGLVDLDVGAGRGWARRLTQPRPNATARSAAR